MLGVYFDEAQGLDACVLRETIDIVLDRCRTVLRRLGC